MARDRITAEPITALLTVVVSPFPIVWELTSFTYPLVIRLVRRRRTGKAGSST